MGTVWGAKYVRAFCISIFYLTFLVGYGIMGIMGEMLSFGWMDCIFKMQFLFHFLLDFFGRVWYNVYNGMALHNR